MRNQGIFSLLSHRNCYIACGTNEKSGDFLIALPPKLLHRRGTNEKIPFIDYKKEPDLARSGSFL